MFLYIETAFIRSNHRIRIALDFTEYFPTLKAREFVCRLAGFIEVISRSYRIIKMKMFFMNDLNTKHSCLTHTCFTPDHGVDLDKCIADTSKYPKRPAPVKAKPYSESDSIKASKAPSKATARETGPH